MSWWIAANKRNDSKIKGGGHREGYCRPKSPIATVARRKSIAGLPYDSPLGWRGWRPARHFPIAVTHSALDLAFNGSIANACPCRRAVAMASTSSTVRGLCTRNT